jgi:hypothetical protein
MGWAKEILLERANRWAAKHGYEPVTEASLLEWKKEGLIPNPKPVGRGRGRGKAEEWTSLAYHRVLQILRLRANGIIHRRDQRLILWLAGNDIRPDFIRKDLAKIWGAGLKKTGRETGIEFRAEPKPSDKKIKELLPPHLTEDILIKLGLGKFSSIFLEVLEPAFLSREFQGIIKDIIYTYFDPDYQGLKKTIAKMIRELPDDSSERNIAEEELVYGVGAISGIIAEEFYNPVLEALETSSDELLLNIRDFILIWNSLWKAGFRLFKAALSYDPKTFLGLTGFMLKPLIENVFSLFENIDFLTTPSDKLALFGLLLRRTVIRENNGEAFRKIVELRIDKVIRWMADNFEIFADEKISLDKKEALVQASPLSEEMKSDILKDLNEKE